MLVKGEGETNIIQLLSGYGVLKKVLSFMSNEIITLEVACNSKATRTVLLEALRGLEVPCLRIKMSKYYALEQLPRTTTALYSALSTQSTPPGAKQTTGEESFIPTELEWALSKKVIPKNFILDFEGRNHGEPELLFLVAWKNVALISLVLRYCDNTNVNARHSTSKRGPLFLASEKGLTEIVEMLLMTGANATMVDNYLNTPLHAAACGGYADVISALCEKAESINVNAHGNRDYTPLHVAAENGHLEAVKCLLKYGANKDERTRSRAERAAAATAATS
jgi:ankyrin repeat protein